MTGGTVLSASVACTGLSVSSDADLEYVCIQGVWCVFAKERAQDEVEQDTDEPGATGAMEHLGS